MVTLQDAKNYCRATDEDDSMVQNLILSAESYLDGAVDDFSLKYANAGENWKRKADLCELMLIADWYENRTPTQRPSNSAIELLIVQLQLEAVTT